MASRNVTTPLDVPGADLPPVLFIGDHFGYPGGVAHGATIYFLGVLPELKRAGARVIPCFLREPHPAAAALEGTGVEPVFMSAAPADPFVVMKVAALARREGCGIIHAAGLKGSLIGRMVGRMLRLPVIVHLHDMHMPGAFSRVAHGILGRDSDLAICVSRATTDVAVTGYRVPRSRTRVVYNGVKLDTLRHPHVDARRVQRESMRIAADAPVIAMIGRMFLIKGHRGMIRMMASIVAAVPDAVLILAGDGPDRGHCEAMVAELGIQDNVRFLGHRADVPDLLAAADMVVMPSLSEGLGLAAIEALAVGLPVVAFATGGLGEVVTDGVDGRVVPPGDEAGFARAVIQILQDDRLRESYGRQASASAERFSLPAHIEQLLDCYHEAIGLATLRPVTA